MNKPSLSSFEKKLTISMSQRMVEETWMLTYAPLNVYMLYIICFMSLQFCCLWPPSVADAHIIFSSCAFFLLLSSFSTSPNLSGCRLDVYHTSTNGLKCAACAIGRLHTIAQLCPAMSLQLRHVSTTGHYIGHQPTFQLWSPYGLGQTIIFSCCYLFFLLLFFLA